MKIKIYNGCTNLKISIYDRKGADVTSIANKKLLLEKLVYDTVVNESDLDRLLEQILYNQEPSYHESSWCDDCGNDTEYYEYKLTD